LETNFETVIDGAKSLLLDSSSILNGLKIDYVVIGGWCPMLRNTRTDLVHPGTKDIDILFRDADVPLKLQNVIQAFLDRGYLVSAKHDFQLFRIINVSGHKLVFNIDLLHPSESQDNPEMFVDHFEFDFCENQDLFQKKMMKSIVLPSSAIIFEGYYDNIKFEAQRFNGCHGETNLPLINEAGLVLSKCQSVKSIKRERDAFDIYLVLSQENINPTIHELSNIYHSNEDVKFLLDDFRSYLQGKSHVFDKNVQKYCPKDFFDEQVSPSKKVSQVMNKMAEPGH
jgi:hypothetical protein